MPDTSPESDLYTRLLAIRKRQLEAPEKDETTLASYLECVKDMYDFAKSVLSRTTLSTKTANLLHTITASDFISSESMLRLRGAIREVGKAREADIVSAMAKLSLEESNDREEITKGPGKRKDSSPPPDNAFGSRVTSKDAIISRSDMDFAKQWAWNHLDNLYPQKDVKKMIAKRCEVSESYVNAWFIQLRRRIGWNKIVKNYFRGDKAEAIEAAQSIFLGEKPATQHINSKANDALIAMKEAAERYLVPVSASEIERQVDELIKVVQVAPGPKEAPTITHKAHSKEKNDGDNSSEAKGTKRVSGETSLRAPKRLKASPWYDRACL